MTDTMTVTIPRQMFERHVKELLHVIFRWRHLYESALLCHFSASFTRRVWLLFQK